MFSLLGLPRKVNHNMSGIHHSIERLGVFESIRESQGCFFNSFSIEIKISDIPEPKIFIKNRLNNKICFIQYSWYLHLIVIGRIYEQKPVLNLRVGDSFPKGYQFKAWIDIGRVAAPQTRNESLFWQHKLLNIVERVGQALLIFVNQFVVVNFKAIQACIYHFHVKASILSPQFEQILVGFGFFEVLDD